MSREVELDSQASSGEIKSLEVELDSQASSGEIKSLEVELDSQENPGDIKSGALIAGSTVLLHSCSSTVRFSDTVSVTLLR